MSEGAEEGRMRWGHVGFREWLTSSTWSVDELAAWLEGYESLPLGHDDEPYLWFLRGLPVADERFNAETVLADRVAVILGQQPDISWPGRRPERALYNLLLLCAGLSCPDQLAEPLFALFQRRALHGDWLGGDLRAALRAALIENQLDSRLQDEWQTMIEDRGHAFLLGDEYAGFEGVLRMPESPSTRGEPALTAIGRALATIARHLEDLPTRAWEFRELIAKLVQTYPGRPQGDLELVWQADKHAWPWWAVEALPKLWIPTRPDSRSATVTLLSRTILECLPGDESYAVARELCRGTVVEVVLDEKAAQLVRRIAPIFEEKRRENPLSSRRALLGGVITAMTEAELVLEPEQPENAQWIREARVRRLDREL
jgi:hypothetical protein